MSPSTCEYCTQEMCFMCENPTDEDTCCCKGTYGRSVTLKNPTGRPRGDKDYSGLPMAQIPPNRRAEFADREFVLGRPRLEGDDMKNSTHAGRTRAKEVAPLIEGMICEWQGLSHAGGGVVPIVGCIAGMAEHRHHGPDKGTLNNAVGVNLHRICTACHNRWHSLNDKYYGERPRENLGYLPTEEFKEHDRTSLATTKEQLAEQRWWNTPKADRKEYRSWLTESGELDYKT